MPATIEDLERDLIAKGLLIEAGFHSLRTMAIAPDAPADQIEWMRNAFFAGAQHLFATVLRVLEPGEEPTTADLLRMPLIQAELERFIVEFQAKHMKTEGSA